LNYTVDLEKAIEFIISKLEETDHKNILLKSGVKMYFLVRMDLKMGIGKISAQVGHAALRAFQQIR
jgi:hypothetical protein